MMVPRWLCNLAAGVVLMLLLTLPWWAARAVPVVPDEIPEAMPAAPIGDDVEIFLLFGTATDNPANPGMADTVMLVAVHHDTQSAAMLAIPRDLWVYAPDAGMMKLTGAHFYGETHPDIEGGGAGLLRRTLEYNLGIQIDHYAQVNFSGFLSLIDRLGGVTLAVDCVIRDWKLKERHLDKRIEENYALFTLPIGLHTLDADTALWYVRSRRTSSDLDRGRRQQDVLRAIWRQIKTDGLLNRLPDVWDTVTQHVRTDLTLANMAGYVPLALQIDADRIRPMRFVVGTEITQGLSPAPEHASILVPQRDAVAALVREFVTPPNANRIARAGLRVQIVNASGHSGLAYVAADRLSQEGFVTEIIEEPASPREFNAIYDYTGHTKGSVIDDLKRVLRVTDAGVVVQPDAARAADFKIYLGQRYAYWACTRNVIQPPADSAEGEQPEG